MKSILRTYPMPEGLRVGLRLLQWFLIVSLEFMSTGKLGAEDRATSSESVLRIHVLPLAFSAESRKNYGDWIARLESAGYGNAVWLELEDSLYDESHVVLIQSPLQEEEFQRILRARATQATAGEATPSYELPDQLVSVNANFFTRVTEKVSMLKSSKTTEFSVTIYLRFFDLKAGKLNRAIPAQAAAVDIDPVQAARRATREAGAKLLERLRRAEILPAATKKGAPKRPSDR